MHEPPPSALRALAARFGVQTQYVAQDGRPVESSEDAIRWAIAALAGGDADGVLDLAPDGEPGLVGTNDLDVVIAWDGVPPPLPGDVVVTDTEGRLLTAPFPFGYHAVVRGDTAVGTVISAPRFAPAPTPGTWGVFLPLYSLRTARTRGLADFTDLAALFDWLHDRHGAFVLTLPLLPVFLDDPADWSPYSPITRRMWSDLYVDLDALGAPSPDGPPPEPVDDLLDYPALHRHRVPRLQALADRLVDDPELGRWAHEHPLAVDYARFRARQERFGRLDVDWPTADASGDPAVERRHLVGAWLADRQLSDLSDRLRSRGQFLALDVALGAHPDGFDVWREGDLFARGVHVGAPPDPLFEGGQDWGFPPVHPWRSRTTGHRYVRETLRHHLEHAGLLRLDHVLGLFRQWWVPAGAAATDGAYVHFPFEELLAVACLEAHLAGSVIVGENLGTVPPEVDRGLEAHGILGIHVGLETLLGFGRPDRRRSRRGMMASLTTHDSVPFAGYWWGHDVERSLADGFIDESVRDWLLGERRAMRDEIADTLRRDGRLVDPSGSLATADPTTAEIVAGVVEDLAAQDAEIVVVGLEDLWSEERPQNQPGTFQERPNWRRVACAPTRRDRGRPRARRGARSRRARPRRPSLHPGAHRGRPTARADCVGSAAGPAGPGGGEPTWDAGPPDA